MPEHDPEIVQRRLEEFRKNLLDISLRNRLVNFRTRTKSGKDLEKVVEVTGESPAELHKLLVLEKKAMRFGGKPDPKSTKGNQLSVMEDADHLAEAEDYDRHADVNTSQDLDGSVDQTDLVINTDYTVTTLQRKLLKIQRDARVAVEEQGVNVLFLALGGLRWFEAEASEEERTAPLILVPVRLESTKTGTYRLVWDEGDPGGNLPIAAKVKAEFGIELPTVPEELDVQAYFKSVERAVKSQGRWSVDAESVALAFFSYAKYLMYLDLSQEKWPINRKPSCHDTLGALLDCGFDDSEPGLTEEDFPEAIKTALESSEVYDSDSSQTLAILEAGSGRSLIIEGPPGTGKSQTITNLIAEYVFQGKKVLFVAEKATALDVVYRRLQEAHLEDACLELHSHKANKRSFYTSLNHTVSIAAPRAAKADEDYRRIEEAKRDLNGYAKAVNTEVDGRGITPRWAMGALMQLGGEESPEGRHSFKEMAGWNQQDFERKKEIVQRLQGQIAAMGMPSEHPYFGCTLDHVLPQDLEDIRRFLVEASRAVEALNESGNAIAEAMCVEPIILPSDVENYRDWAKFISQAPDLKGVRIGNTNWNDFQPQLAKLVAIGKKLNETKGQIAGSLTENAYSTDVSQLRSRFRFAGLINAPLSDGSSLDLKPLLASLEDCSTTCSDVVASSLSLAAMLGVNPPARLWAMEPLAALAKRVSSAPDLTDIPVSDPAWGNSASLVEDALRSLRRYQAVKSQFGGRVRLAAWTQDVTRDIEVLTRLGGRFFKFLYGEYRSTMRKTAEYCVAAAKSPAERLEALNAIKETQELDNLITGLRGKCSTLFGPSWVGVVSDAKSLSEIASWVQEIHAAVDAEKVPREVLTSLERGIDLQGASRIADTLRAQAQSALSAIQRFRKALVATGVTELEDSTGDTTEKVYSWVLEVLQPNVKEVSQVVRSCETRSLWELLDLLDRIAEVQKLRRLIAASHEMGTCMGDYWRGEETSWNELGAVLAWVVDLLDSVSADRLPDGLVTFFAGEYPREKLNAAVERAQTDRATAHGAVKRMLEAAQLHDAPDAFTEEPVAIQREKLSNWQARIADLPQLIRYNALAAEAHRHGLHRSIELAEQWDLAGSQLVDSFERCWYTGIVRKAVKDRPELGQFDRVSHEEIIAKFRELDDHTLRLNRAKVALAHWRSVPRASVGGAMGWLKTQFELKSRHKPIRVAMEKAGVAIQAIKPVFLMSPLSVAMYLPPDGPAFDVVIFDEASQVKPEDAFGGLLRAKQTIVVGDSKQMPPTSFFDKLTQGDGDDEDEELDDQIGAMKDLESVLALMSKSIPAASPQRRDLRWHYRSRHDGLIATSNRLFYDDKLVVFPSPWRAGVGAGLILRHDPTTVYGRGGTRKNPAEAKAVALAVHQHILKSPNLTIGVAAFSKAQQEAIQDELYLLQQSDPAFASFDAAHPYEPLVVKNLENIQGDERDVIFISVGYGRDENNFISASFGPLNRDGGERRLNVLITRARVRCEVFSNIKASDVRQTENSAKGVHALKTFLAFADSGSLDIPAKSEMDPQSPFEELVINRLRSSGYDVDPQVGSCGFYIDIGVKHPEQQGRYVLGIECDGAMYHRARSARDRDKLRQAVLESRGWRIHRIWSTDWFNNPEREFDRLVKAVQSAIHLADDDIEVEPSSMTLRPYTELERDHSVEAQTWLRPYETCDLRVNLGYEELHEQPSSKLADWIVEVVKVESPIHFSEVVRRIREAAGLKRAGNRINQAIQLGAALAKRQRRIDVSGEFLLTSPTSTITVRDRTGQPGPLRQIEAVAPEEISEALRLIVSESFGIEPQEAIILASKALGFERTTEQISAAIAKSLKSAVRSGAISSVDGLLRAPESSMN